MDVGIKDKILAVVTLDEKKIISSGVPIFMAEDQKELEKTSLLIAKITTGMVHDLENGCYIIVKH